MRVNYGLSIMAYISISLGLINLFPIPLLDGGHLFFYLIEFIRGKPLNEQIQEYFYRFGFFILFTLMFFATFRTNCINNCFFIFYIFIKYSH